MWHRPWLWNTGRCERHPSHSRSQACHHGETLTDVVVKLSANPATFLLLCLNQLAADVSERGVSQLALGDVYKSDHCPDNLLLSPLRIRLIFSLETCSVRPPQHVVLRVDSFTSTCYPVNSTLLCGARCPIRTSVMDQIMHILASHFIKALVSQNSEAGGIAERASVLEINSVYSLGSRVEDQSEFVFALAQSLLRLSQFCQVD